MTDKIINIDSAFKQSDSSGGGGGATTNSSAFGEFFTTKITGESIQNTIYGSIVTPDTTTGGLNVFETLGANSINGYMAVASSDVLFREINFNPSITFTIRNGSTASYPDSIFRRYITPFTISNGKKITSAYFEDFLNTATTIQPQNILTVSVGLINESGVKQELGSKVFTGSEIKTSLYFRISGSVIANGDSHIYHEIKFEDGGSTSTSTSRIATTGSPNNDLLTFSLS